MNGIVTDLGRVLFSVDYSYTLSMHLFCLCGGFSRHDQMGDCTIGKDGMQLKFFYSFFNDHIFFRVIAKS